MQGVGRLLGFSRVIVLRPGQDIAKPDRQANQTNQLAQAANQNKQTN